jgi:hypothetical protein
MLYSQFEANFKSGVAGSAFVVGHFAELQVSKTGSVTNTWDATRVSSVHTPLFFVGFRMCAIRQLEAAFGSEA